MKIDDLTVINAQSPLGNLLTDQTERSTKSRDAACAIAGISGLATALTMYRYANDESVLPVLGYRAWLVAVEAVNRDGWRPPQGSEIVRKMSRVALFELLERRAKDCEVAESIGVGTSAYARTWKPRYQSVRSAITGWCAQLDDEVKWSVRRW